jgi:hypothetical protein
MGLIKENTISRILIATRCIHFCCLNIECGNPVDNLSDSSLEPAFSFTPLQNAQSLGTQLIIDFGMLSGFLKMGPPLAIMAALPIPRQADRLRATQIGAGTGTDLALSPVEAATRLPEGF